MEQEVRKSQARGRTGPVFSTLPYGNVLVSNQLVSFNKVNLARRHCRCRPCWTLDLHRYFMLARKRKAPCIVGGNSWLRYSREATMQAYLRPAYHPLQPERRRRP